MKRSFIHRFLEYNTEFVSFGLQHWLILILIVLSSILIPYFAIYFLTDLQQLWFGRFFSITLALTVLGWMFIRAKLGDFDKTTDLPLDFCNLSALLLPFMMWNPNLPVHEVLFFWILTGTLLANVTPYLYNGFPNFIFMKYWIVHGGLVVLTIYYTVVFELYPEWWSILKAFGWLHVYLFAMVIANKFIGSNYFYLLGKPPTPTILDYLGPWPWYILVCWGLVLILFTIVYLPIYIFLH